MRRWRGLALGAVFLGMAVLPGQSCGPFFTEAVFVVKQPASRTALMDGKLGIVWTDFGTVDTALVYRVLQGPAFTAEEKEQMLAWEGPEQGQVGASGDMSQWVAARNQFTGQDGGAIVTDANVPGQQWQTYSNCLADAFATAVLTLKSRESEYASVKPAVAEWVRGQDAVFSNCGGAGQLPAEPGASTPGWLREDRAYQTAAAHFYRAEWQPAQAAFAAIAGDRSSPWHDVAAYMVARTLLRQATLTKPDFGAIDEAPMRAAQAQLEKLVQQGGKYAGAAKALLSLVDLRLAPGATAARQGDAIAKPDPQLHQDLIDLRYVVTQPDFGKHIDEARRSELVDWVLTTRQSVRGAEAHALERWRATKSAAWLMSAMILARSPQPELMAAAAALPRSSPAWLTVTYHRLRLTSDDAAVKAEIAHLVPEIDKTETASTVNAFQLLAQQKVSSLDEFIKFAAIEPAGYDDGMDPITTAARTSFLSGTKAPTIAGLPVDTGKRFTPEAAMVLNERLPLETLAAIVGRRAYPKQLQFELAMAVWTRAVLLGKPEVARSLTAALVEGEPGWKQWLQAYDDAKTDDDRKAAAMLALMRFPSVRPYVNAGAGREDGFVGYSVFRDNWWCAGMGTGSGWANSYSGSDNDDGATQGGGQTKPAEVWPAFVSPAMRSQAKQENAALAKIGDAPQYFGSQALAWVKAHPGDPRGAELLGFAFRAMRNGCNLEQVAGLRHEVFNTLHAKYGQSEWARRYPDFSSE